MIHLIIYLFDYLIIMIKVGPSFSENVYTAKAKGRKGLDTFTLRPSLLLGILIITLGIIIGRVFFLQIVNGANYRQLSDVNRSRTLTLPAPRGIFTDRNGIALVANVPATTSAQASYIDKRSIPLLREYPYGNDFAHVIGYVGPISPTDMANPQYTGDSASEEIGKAGLEQYYEQELRGVDGRELIEVNAQGNFVKVLGVADPIPGQTLRTTLDLKLQEAAVSAMQWVAKGALVISDPQGGILAMVSKPDFDPNLFSIGHQLPGATASAYTNVGQIVTDNQGQPLLNRVIAGEYPPGSTFKIIVAAAALEEKLIDANFVIEDTGILQLGGFSFSNWYWTDDGKTDGLVNVVKAIQRSNDIFFYKVGSLVGVDKITQWAKKFGLGAPTGIDLYGEAAGFLPTKEWKQETLHQDWYTGDDYHYGIGQGFLLTTPLQVNLWTQAIANNGTIYQPHLLMDDKPKIIDKNFLSANTIDLIKQGMIEACSPGGVAYPLYNFGTSEQVVGGMNIDDDFYEFPASVSAKPGTVGVRLACKTGTAEHGDDSLQPHAWITVIAPAYHPQLIITILSESSGQGSDVGGPIAKKILDAWFNNQ